MARLLLCFILFFVLCLSGCHGVYYNLGNDMANTFLPPHLSGGQGYDTRHHTRHQNRQPRRYTEEYGYRGKTNFGSYNIKTRTRYDERRGTVRNLDFRWKGRKGETYRYTGQY